MFTDDEKRKQIRAAFFPHRDTSEFQWKVINSLFKTIGIITLVIIIIGIKLAITEKSIEFGVVAFFLPMLVFGGLIALVVHIFRWFGFDILYEEENHKEDTKEQKELMKKFGLTNSDLARKPSISQIDTWLDEDLTTAIDHAFDKLTLTRNELVRDPMVIYGPLFWSTYGIPDDDLIAVKNTDGTLRFSCYQLVLSHSGYEA